MRATDGNRRARTWQELAGLVAASLLTVSVIGGGTASAATPAGWVAGHGTNSSPTALQPGSGASSAIVGAGNTVGFFEWLRNDGPSNISQLYVNETTSATVVGAQWTIKDSSGQPVPGRSGFCPVAPSLVCNIGALNATQTAYLVAAFAVPASAANRSLGVAFGWNTTGVVVLSGKNKSHGDAISQTDQVQVAGSNNADADGDFNFGDATNELQVQTAPVGGNNKQSTFLAVGGTQVGAAVSDSPSLPPAKCTDALIVDIVTANPWFSCQQLTSLTSVVEAGNGRTFGTPFKVIVTFKNAPSQLTGPNPFVYHYYVDTNGAEHAELITPCAATPVYPCITVGNNVVTIQMFHNGPMRM